MRPDRIDDALLPVFIEEGKELLAVIGDALMKFRDAPDKLALLSAMRGPIHTIKGSARMTGAMQFGQHWHIFEGMIARCLQQQGASMEDVAALLAHYDHGVHLLSLLQQPEAGNMGQAIAHPVSGAGRHQDPGRKPRQTVAYVRVRANVLDQFLNQAGEIVIAGSHVESHVAQLQTVAHALAANIARVDKQVRQVAMQADIHMQSTDGNDTVHTGFDPLELDRFTQWQELARTMTEGLGDIAALQKNLSRLVGAVRESDAKRARLTRTLQQEIMAARMVPFKSIQDRLQRLIRQASRDVDKEVRLDVLGAHQEVDRSVLEKIVTVLEHLLRNAIAHGIEHRLVRLDLGKRAHGTVSVEVRTEGNELLIRVADDGQGMDLPRIKARAVRDGVLRQTEEVTMDNLFDVIAHPGLSTTDNVSALSGRGVGLDVVRTEIIALGGRVEVDTRAAQGTAFMIYLPMTLAVTQVVLVRVGRATYAIPSRYVAQVLHAADAGHLDRVAGSTWQCQGRAVPVACLARLLQVQRDAHHPGAALMIKHGKQQMVILVDAVLGNKEVVTKNMGVQLARMNGIVGVTILGTGEIVLILHPALLIHRRDQASLVPDVPAQKVPDEPFTIMIVDDSLTVRRVLEKRLLREGYAVMMAKDGMDALLQLQIRVPDLFLLDIEMPRMDGFQLLQTIRERTETATTPVVMVTSRAARKHRNRALALGANAYLGKPYQEEELLALIASLVTTPDA